jgi:hypothetical protein
MKLSVSIAVVAIWAVVDGYGSIPGLAEWAIRNTVEFPIFLSLEKTFHFG